MKKLAVICCSVLKREVTEILAQDYPQIECSFLDSMLHMYPALLQKTLEETLSAQSLPALIIYGDCGPDMEGLEKHYPCIRTPAVNCTELIVGRERYRTLRSDEAFLLLPEWTERWKEVFQKELGFTSPELARSFIHDYRKCFVYLDTGLIPVPLETLREIEAYFEMPVTILKETMDPLRLYIRDGIRRLEAEVNNEP